MIRSPAAKFAIYSLFALVSGCGGDSTGELIERLRSDDPQVRRGAERALSELDDEASLIVPALEQTLADTDPAVRLSAALAIERLEPANESTRPVIIASLEAGHAAMFLEVGRMGRNAQWAVPTLVKLLSHPQPQIRVLAARAIGEIGVADDVVQKALERRLRDEAAAVRQAVEQTLEQIQTVPGVIGQ